MDIKKYFPGLLCFALLLLGFGTGTLAVVLSVSWAYVVVKIVNHYILKKSPEDQNE